MSDDIDDDRMLEPEKRKRLVQLRERRLELEITQREAVIAQEARERARPWIRRRWVVQSAMAALASAALVWFYFERVAIPVSRNAALRSEYQGLKQALDNERAREQLRLERDALQVEKGALERDRSRAYTQLEEAGAEIAAQGESLAAEKAANAELGQRLAEVAGGDAQIRVLEARLLGAEENREELEAELAGLRVERDDAIARLAEQSASRAASLDQAIESTQQRQEDVQEIAERVRTDIRTRPLNETYSRTLSYQINLGATKKIDFQLVGTRVYPPRGDFEEPWVAWAALDLGLAESNYKYQTMSEEWPDIGFRSSRRMSDVVHLGSFEAKEVLGNNVGVRAMLRVGPPFNPANPFVAAKLEALDSRSGKILWSSGEVDEYEYAVTLHFIR